MDMAQVFIAIAGAIHIYIFVMESVLWGKPKTNRIFGLSPQLAEQNRVFAFNQGYYNLFLAIGAILGVAFSFAGHPTVGLTLMLCSSASMIGASLALLYSQPKLKRPALIQGLPPMLGLIFLGIQSFH